MPLESSLPDGEIGPTLEKTTRESFSLTLETANEREWTRIKL
jgi:hypothetical protein